MSDLAKRKQMLIAESEVYRQTLRLELQNVRLFTTRTAERFKGWSVPRRAWMLAAAGAWAVWGGRRKHRFSLLRMGSLGVIGWQLYQRIVPFCQGLLSGGPHDRDAGRVEHAKSLWHKKDTFAA